MTTPHTTTVPTTLGQTTAADTTISDSVTIIDDSLEDLHGKIMRM